VAPMSYASVAGGADAIMLEVHPDPANAKVDPLQPVDFEEFEKIMTTMDAVAHSIGRSVRG